MSAIITASQVYKSFADQEVLRDISFEVRSTEKVIFLGRSGSGKTTLLKILNQLVKHDRGEVEILGRPVKNWKINEMRREMGYVIQQIGLFPYLNVLDNLKITFKINKEKPPGLGFFEQLMEQMGLPPSALKKYPAELSGGQQQRVGLARALARNPGIILMDEPFSALDPIIRKQLQDDLLHLESLKDKTIVMVTHDVEEAFKLGDRIILLQDGKVLENGSPFDLIFRSDKKEVHDFLSKDELALKMKLIGLNDLSIAGIVDNVSVYEYLNNVQLNPEMQKKVIMSFVDHMMNLKDGSA
jgi:osmoprotectant transport system ATP-binding protein